MEKITAYRLRKYSDVRADAVYFEVVDQNNRAVLDVGFSENKKPELVFLHACQDRSIDFELLTEILKDAEKNLREWNES